jgi:hypothetical protein
MRINVCGGMTLLMIGMLTIGAFAQTSHWAAADDPTAKYMIDKEREWAEAGCTTSPLNGEFLADDFQGTAPDGHRYDKAAALKVDSNQHERDCKLDEAKVKFFGENAAMIYGSERATRKDQSGKEGVRCLVWTDTWMKRDGKWQIIAVQDAETKCK